MARRYFVKPLPAPGEALLSASLGHYLGRTARMKVGDSAVLFDGEGRERHATILEVLGRDVRVDVGALHAAPFGGSPRVHLDVACALPKNPRADWLFEHGTEAGVRAFRPIVTARSRRQLERPKHWERVLIKACAQCDRRTLPSIEPTVTIGELCQSDLPEERYVATFAECELGPATSREVLLVVGPEGGFTYEELALLDEARFVPRSLGPLTLRTETAVFAGAVRLQQARDARAPDPAC